jgi:acid stress-induced BolA-like protein IbaG/YrbA
MVSHEEIEQRLTALSEVTLARASGDGYHYQLTVVSNQFEGQSPVRRQQWVYAQLNDYITTGRLHALTMKTWTVAEWEKQHG